jgi:hypothetical protein
MKYRVITSVLWPAFVVAIMAEGFLFSITHPAELLFFGHHPDISDEGIYTIGFMMIWFFLALSSLLTLYIQPPIDHKKVESIDERKSE